MVFLLLALSLLCIQMSSLTMNHMKYQITLGDGKYFLKYGGMTLEFNIYLVLICTVHF